MDVRPARMATRSARVRALRRPGRRPGVRRPRGPGGRRGRRTARPSSCRALGTDFPDRGDRGRRRTGEPGSTGLHRGPTAPIAYERSQEAPARAGSRPPSGPSAPPVDLKRFALALRARLADGRDADRLAESVGLGARPVPRSVRDVRTRDRRPGCRPRSSTPRPPSRACCPGWRRSPRSNRRQRRAGSSRWWTRNSSAALPRVGRFGDGVFVGPLSASIGLDVDLTFVVGLAEDTYPGRLHPDPLLSPAARLASGGALPGERDRLNAAHRHLLAAFASAPLVQASFPRGNLRRSTDRLPSRWLLWTLRELSGRRDLAATEWKSARSRDIVESPSFAAALLRSDPRSMATEQEWRIRASSARLPLDDPVIDAGRRDDRRPTVRRRSPATTGISAAVNGSPRLSPPGCGRCRRPPSSRTRAARTGTSSSGCSASSRSSSPRTTITISPLDIGNLIHEAMDDLVRAFPATLCRIRPAVAGRAPGGAHGDRHQTRRARSRPAARPGIPGSGSTSGGRILDDLAAMLTDDDGCRSTAGCRGGGQRTDLRQGRGTAGAGADPGRRGV